MRTFTFSKIVAEAPLIAIVSVTLALVSITGKFVIIPKYMHLRALQKELTYYNERISSEHGYTDLEKTIHRKLDSLESRLKSSTGDRIPAADISGYLEFLISLARKSSIQFVRMQPQNEKITVRETIHPVLLLFSTTYHELGVFISALEKRPHLYRIDRIALDAGSNGMCEVKLLLNCLVPTEAGK